MVDRRVIEHQLHQIGFNPFSWGRAEVSELCNIMMDGEVLTECVNGEYSNGFALLAATNHRVLLVDKKPFLYLTVEDVRFEQISDFNFRNRFLTAQLTVSTSNKTLHFTSYNKKRLRHLISCVQRHVIDMRNRSKEAQRQFQSSGGWQQVMGLGIEQSASQDKTQKPTPQHQPVVDTSSPPAPKDKANSVTAGAAEAKRRSQLAIYTRGKLPSFRRSKPPEVQAKPPIAATAPVSKVYQQGYVPGSVPDYQM